MHVKIFDKTEVVAALGAVRAVAASPSPAQDSLLAAVAGLHGVDVYPRLLPKSGPIRVDRTLHDARCRRRVLELAVAFATNHGDVQPAAAEGLAALARTLGHSDSDVRRLRDIASHYYLRARIDFTRRMAARVFGDTWPRVHVDAVQQLGRIQHIPADPVLAGRYHALAELHPTTFGYAIWDHFRRNAFRLPGEGGGVPERLLAHDVAHVLSGYATDAESELLQAAFQTGCTRDDGFMPLYFGMLQFQFAARVTVGASDSAPHLDFEQVAAAIARGASCRVDLGDDWDFWAFLPWALSDVQQNLGIPRLDRRAAA